MLQLRDHEGQKVVSIHIGHAVRFAATRTGRGEHLTGIGNNRHDLGPQRPIVRVRIISALVVLMASTELL